MAEFIYTAGAERGSFTIEANNPTDLMYQAVDKLLLMLQEKGLEIIPDEQPYLESQVAVAITRYLPSGRAINLDSLAVRPTKPKDELPIDAEDVYTLINIPLGAHVRRSYSLEQPVGAIIADLRKLYSLGPNDHIVIFQVVDGDHQPLNSAKLVKQLLGKELHWKAKPYE